MKLGYFVVYGDDPHEDIKESLLIAGCEPEGDRKGKTIYWDRIRKLTDPRPGRNALIRNLREGDELLIPDLFDLCGTWRKIRHFKSLLDKKGVKLLVRVEEQIEFTGESDLLITGFIEKHNKFQTMAGNEARRQNRRGKGVGAPKGPRDKEAALRAMILRDKVDEKGNPSHTIVEICRILGVAKGTYYRYIEYAEKQSSKPK